MHVTVRELVLLAAQLRACLPFFSGGRYGGRAWLAPPPCAPRRPANRAPRAGRVHVRRVPAMAAWLARRQARRQLHRLRVLGESITTAGSDHAAPAVNAPSSSCAYGQLLPRRRTEARVRGADHWPPVEHLAQDQHAAREALLGPRFRLICAACLWSRDTHRASTPRESIRRRMCPPPRHKSAGHTPPSR